MLSFNFHAQMRVCALLGVPMQNLSPGLSYHCVASSTACPLLRGHPFSHSTYHFAFAQSSLSAILIFRVLLTKHPCFQHSHFSPSLFIFLQSSAMVTCMRNKLSLPNTKFVRPASQLSFCFISSF